MPVRRFWSHLFLSSLLFFGSGCGGGGGNEPILGAPVVTGNPNPNNDALPVSRDDSYVTRRNVALYVGAEKGLLVNDTPASASLLLSAGTQQGGSVRAYSEGAFFYTPPRDFLGSDQFSYTLSNGAGSSTSTVTISVSQGGIDSGLSIDFYQGSGRFSLVRPNDPQEFASYLQAQLAGGAAQGGTGVSQLDAIPNTRFARVEDPFLWNAGLARNYACQLAAQSLGFKPLEASGIEQGAQVYGQMSPEAQLFLQVAAVFKGNLLNGPDEYDNPGLRDLLVSKGLTQFINDPLVGVRDVQTLGAIGAAMNAGQLTIADILNSGTFAEVERYDEVVEFVFTGRFRDAVFEYEAVPF